MACHLTQHVAEIGVCCWTALVNPVRKAQHREGSVAGVGREVDVAHLVNPASESTDEHVVVLHTKLPARRYARGSWRRHHGGERNSNR